MDSKTACICLGVFMIIDDYTTFVGGRVDLESERNSNMLTYRYNAVHDKHGIIPHKQGTGSPTYPERIDDPNQVNMSDKNDRVHVSVIDSNNGISENIITPNTYEKLMNSPIYRDENTGIENTFKNLHSAERSVGSNRKEVGVKRKQVAELIQKMNNPMYKISGERISTPQKRIKRKAVKEQEKLSYKNEAGKNYIDDYTKVLQELLQRPSVTHQISPFDYDPKAEAIKIKFIPSKVLSVNEKEQSVSIASYVDLKWNDDSLRWDPSKYNITSIKLKSDSVWIPSIILPKANGDGFILRTPDYVSVNTEEKYNVKLSTLFKFTTSCKLDLSRFPFDTQTCSILFRDENSRPLNPTYRYYNPDVTMQWADIGGEWDIIQNGAEVSKQSEQVETTDAASYTITMQRRSSFYVANLLIPLHMTSFMALFVFWIPPETGEKISFMVSIYVSTAMYLSFIIDVLPHSLTRLPSFNIITVCINVQIALTFIASLLVLRQFRKQTDSNNKTTTTTITPSPPRPTSSNSTSHILPSYSNTVSPPPRSSTPPLPPPIHNKDSTHHTSTLPKKTPKIKNNSVAAIDNLEQSWARPVYRDDDLSRLVLKPSSPNRNWMDYKFLDKIFFAIFSLAFVVILIVPWFITV